MARDLHQVLREKEQDVERVCREIAALRSVIPLLEEEPEKVEQTREAGPLEIAQPTGTDGMVAEAPAPRFWMFGRKNHT